MVWELPTPVGFRSKTPVGVMEDRAIPPEAKAFRKCGYKRLACHERKYSNNTRGILKKEFTPQRLYNTLQTPKDLTGELSLCCARPAADRVNRPLQVSQPGQLSLSSFRGRQVRSKLYYQMCVTPLGWRHLVNAYRAMASCG